MRFFGINKKCPDKDCEEVACPKVPCQKGCMPLSEVKAGNCVCVRRHNGCGKMRKRLLDLGLTPQAMVDVVRKAPMGGPIVLKIGGFDIALSKSEAVHVEVDLAD